MSRRGGGLGIGACRLRGILGGIFVKIPPKTSKNVLLEMRALLVRSVRCFLGSLGPFGKLFGLSLLLYARPEGEAIAQEIRY